jgi:hypothetical protein
MNISEMHRSFKLELDKTSSLELPAYEPEEIDFWLNNAIRKFVKTRYSGINSKGESFEQSQKRIDDLRTLVTQDTLTPTLSTFRDNTWIVDLTDLTEEYWFTLSEEVKIAFLSLDYDDTPVLSTHVSRLNYYKVVGGDITYILTTWKEGRFYTNINSSFSGTGYCVLASSSIEPIKEANSNNFTELLQNPYSEHILHFEKASPLRLFLGDTVELITDGNYDVLLYYIRYIRKPIVVAYGATSYTTADANIEEGVKYEVSVGPVTYNGHTYIVGNTFIGVAGVSAFTNTGTATELGDCDLPEHTHDEVVRLAVNMALENIEQPRYQSHMNEIITME